MKLAYADWLEPRDEERAQLIRLEDELLSLPVYGDRYWALKTERRMLHALCELRWLGAMGYGANYEPVLSAIPEGVKERWRLIRELVERWHEVELPDIGGQIPRINNVESAVGYELPSSIREWICLLGDLMDSDRYDEVFRDCVSWEEIENQRAFSLMIQGEADYHWAVKKEHLHEPDPPVDGYCLDYEHDESKFVHDRVWALRTTTWVMTHIITYFSMRGVSGGFGTHVKDPDTLVRELSEILPVSIQLGDYRIFEAQNLVVSLHPAWGSSDHMYLNVYTWKNLPMEKIPDVLWRYSQQGGWFSGMFAANK